MEVNHTLYMAPELCVELILEEDWLKAQKARLEFVLTKLILGKVEVPLGGNENNTFVVVAREDIKTPPRAMVSCERQILNVRLEGEIH